MASYELRDADVALVVYRRKDGPSKEIFRIAPYLLVTHPDGTSGIQPYPAVSNSNNVQYSWHDFEFNRIEVYDNPPYSGVNSLDIF